MAVAPAYDRPTCYFWRLPNDHPAVAVEGRRLTRGDLLLETAGAVVSDTAAFTDKKVVIDGKRLGRADPVFGEITRDEKSRLVFGDDVPRLRFDREPSPPGRVKNVIQGSKRAIRLYDVDPAKDTDPWYALPRFDERDVLAVQLLLVRFLTTSGEWNERRWAEKVAEGGNQEALMPTSTGHQQGQPVGIPGTGFREIRP